MTFIGNDLKFLTRADISGKIKISGDILAPQEGEISFYFGGLSGGFSPAGLEKAEDGRWGFQISVRGHGRQPFSKIIESDKLKNKTVLITVETSKGLELTSLRVDQWVVNRSLFVHGGCVSRDAFESVDAPPLADYRARSSLVAAFDEKKTGVPLSSLEANPSAFQRRMIRTEIERRLPDLLEEGTFDFFLIDLIVERTALAKTKEGGIVTKSPEFLKTGLARFIAQNLDNTSKEYFEAFRQAWRRLAGIVGESRIIVNRVYWADKDLNGGVVPKRSSVDYQNERLEQLYAIVEDMTPSVFWLNYSPELLRSDSEHKWGPAPYHFGGEFYRAQRSMIRSITMGRVGGHARSVPSQITENGGISLKYPIRLDLEKSLNSLIVRLILIANKGVEGRNALVSFDLRDDRGYPLSRNISVRELGFSQRPGVGWFAYVQTREGLNAWAKTIRLPEGVICTGIAFHPWGNRKAGVSILSTDISAV